jgi:hypothetical protein
MIAGMLLGIYTFFDWHFAFIVLPIGCAIALIVGGAINWWSEHR